MEDIATLKQRLTSIDSWRIAVDKKDEAQDKALYAVESDQRNLKTEYENLRGLLKWVLGFAVATFLSSGLDSIIWNLIHHFGTK